MRFVQILGLVVDRKIFNQRVEIAIMPVDHLLKHAQDYYAHARKTSNPAFKRVLVEIGNTYLAEAEKLKRPHALNTQVVEAIIEPQVI